MNVFLLVPTIVIVLWSIISIIVIVIELIKFYKDKLKWNNGKCKCGGEWECTGVLFNYNGINYNYTCRRCHGHTGYLRFDIEELED